MHRLIAGSAALDRLYWCMRVDGVLHFMEQWHELRQKSPGYASAVLRQYRRRRPWLNLEVYEDRYFYAVPGGCQGMCGFGGLKSTHEDNLWGTMILIAGIKKSDGEKDWDKFGWWRRRKAEKDAAKL